MDRVRRPGVLLASLGAASGASYLAYVLLYPLTVHGQAQRLYDVEKLSRARPWSAAVYAGGLVVLFAAYWLALKLARRAQLSMRAVASFGLAFGLILVWLYPITAIDLFQYIGRARLTVVYQVSPLAVSPDRFPDDPFLYLTGGWKDALSPYGPAWENLAARVVRVSPDDAVGAALAFKALALIAYAACLALLAWGCDRDTHALLLFAWNPLVLLQGVGNGHNDLVMLFWVLLGFLLWQRKRLSIPAIAAMTIGMLTKATAALLLPLLMAAVLREQERRRRLGSLALGVAVVLGLTLIAFLPYWPPWENVGGILTEMGRSSFSLPSPAAGLLRWLLPFNLPGWILNALMLAALAGVYAWALVRVWRGRMGLAEAGLLLLFLYLLMRSSYRIWYPIWLVPLAALHLTRRTRLRTFLLCLTSELSVLTLTLGYGWLFDSLGLPGMDWAAAVAITAPWQFGLPVVLPLLTPRTWTGRRKWGILPDRSAERTEEP